ncbi:hypothetical protein GCM10011452_29880 [Gemmobacter lanyuensis]|uniref:Heme-binding protein n=1 Tax=Gemmobacter lanyuensis TaxID=1054497 RepID=A0A918J1D1_9RHOB|nr:heme-binding protein [Gemmobacter lanyuensis]GGW39606.1 hypothetical protein GCM10011452_29880 [Gemmobacter lanyuensis]
MSKRITHDLAQRALAAGAAKCRALNEPSALAIVDAGGHLLAFLRVDDAAISTLNIAQSKAYTAACLRSPTHQWMEAVQPGGPLYGLEQTSAARPYIFFGGGLPVFDGTRLMGAVGVSGGPAEIDIEIAQEMIVALQG